MSIIRRLTLFSTTLLLRLVLLAACSMLAMVLLFAEPNTLKNSLVNTDAYSRFRDATIQAAADQRVENSLPFDDPIIQEIISTSFPAPLLLQETERALDDTYRWLNGETDSLSFNIDLMQAKDRFARQVADYSVNRISALPVCTSFPDTQDVFKLTCLPPTIDLSELRLEIYESIMQDQSFLASNGIGLQDLPKDEHGQTINEAYPEIPRYFQIAKILPYLLFGVAALIAVVIILLSRTRYHGLRSIASILIFTGVILAITPLFANYITSGVNQTVQNSLTSSGGYGQIINDITNALYRDINAMLINIAIIVASLGLILYIVVRRLQKKQNIYSDLELRSGVSTSTKPHVKGTKGITSKDLPIQSSENNYRARTASKSKKKYRTL